MKGKNMTNKLIQNIVELNERIVNAIENRECFIIVGDWNMVSVWDEELDYLCKFAKEQGYAD
jgi:hypothetical protein